MKLHVIVDEQSHTLDVPDDLIREAEDFFTRMDQDMSRGWRMGPDFVEHPDKINRCQIAANKLLVALSTENKRVLLLMAGFILSRLQGVTGVRIDTGGEMFNTEFLYEHDNAAVASVKHPLTESEARDQIQRDVSKVYRVGKVWKFATFDRQANRWNESPPIETEAGAEARRLEAVQERLGELLG